MSSQIDVEKIIRESVKNVVPLGKDKIKVSMSFNKFLNSFANGEVKIVKSTIQGNDVVLYIESDPSKFSGDNNTINQIIKFKYSLTKLVADSEQVKTLLNSIGSNVTLINDNDDITIQFDMALDIDNKSTVSSSSSNDNKLDF
jgi:hypothetical protein